MPARIALVLSYDGSAFHGFQYQDDTLPTVQLALERAISTVADGDVRITCAGRTDAGVHATHQVIHFDPGANRSISAWVHGTNRYLPHQVRVSSAFEVADDFSARFSATSRRYLYLIDNAPVRSSLMANQLTWDQRPLDEQAMHDGAQYLLGENDFTSFRAAGCQSKSPFREVQSLRVLREGSVVAIDITANAFLQHMVRNIAGVLLRVGTGRRPPAWVEEVLASHDRSSAAITAPPNGLYLVHVAYPEQHGLPPVPSLPHLYSTLLT